MDRRIRILALVLVACMGLLVLQLSNFQIREAASLVANPDNPRPGVPSWSEVPRGDIVASDGTILADSVQTAQGYERQYPDGRLYAAVTGYYDATAESATGLEDEYDGYLVQHTSHANNLSGLLTEGSTVDSLVTTISPHLQQVARAALGGLTGAVVAIVPSTGAVLEMYSNPSFDPNGLSVLDATQAAAFYKSLDPDSNTSPLVNGVIQNPIAPGSTFKVITTAAIFDHDPSVALQNWPVQRRITLPNGVTLQNYAGEACGGYLAEDLAKSCDTAYAQIGMKLGASILVKEATAFGFNKVPPIDLPNAAAAVIPDASVISPKPYTAYSAIGQLNDAETPLEDAMVAAAMADGGTMMAPHLMSEVLSDTGQVVARYQPHPWLQATSAATASMVLNLMLGVVTDGTATGVFSPSQDVAAKTGTAETGPVGCSADWMIATGPANAGDTPTVAVAAELPAQPGLSCSETGAEAAGPIVEQVLAAAGG